MGFGKKVLILMTVLVCLWSFHVLLAESFLESTQDEGVMRYVYGYGGSMFFGLVLSFILIRWLQVDEDATGSSDGDGY